MVVYSYNPRTWEAEAGRSQAQGHTELYSNSLSQNKQNMLAK
jgi:hypothetical protein